MQRDNDGSAGSLDRVLQTVLHERGDWFSFRVSLLGNYYWREITPQLSSRFGLLRDEYVVLAYLVDYGELTANVIAAVSSRPKNSISRAVASLRAKGMVEGAARQGDRRFTVLAATPAGHSLYAAALTLFREWEEDVFGGLSAGERGELDRILSKVQSRLYSRLERKEAPG